VKVTTVILAVVFVGYGLIVYTAWNRRTQSEWSSEAMGLAVNAVGAFITVSVAGASILLAAVGVLIALEPSGRPIPREVFSDLGLATVWLVVSLICGALAAAYVINHIHQKKSVAEHPLVLAFSAAQFAALVLGAIYFVIAMFSF
jgi:preprotein translocase subunit SecG